MPVPVKTYSSVSSGAPVIQNVVGGMGAMLEAILVTGYGATTVSALTWAAGLLKVTCPSPALAAPFVKGRPVAISGGDNEGMNGEWLVSSVNGADVWLSMPTPPSVLLGSSASIKVASLGWELVNKQVTSGEGVWSFKNKASKPCFLRVVDRTDLAGTYGKYARVSIHENIDSAGTFSGFEAPFDWSNPTYQHDTVGTGTSMTTGASKWLYSVSAGFGNTLSSTPENGIKVWDLIGDDKSFFFNIRPSTNVDSFLYGCGNFKSYVDNDQFPHFLMASYRKAVFSAWYVASGYVGAPAVLRSTIGNMLLSDFTGRNVNQFFSLSAMFDGVGVSGYGGFNYPDPISGQIYLSKPRLKESGAGGMRGEFSQFRCFHHSSQFLSRGSVIGDVTGEPGKEFMWLPAGDAVVDTYIGTSLPGFFFDKTGPWEY